MPIFRIFFLLILLGTALPDTISAQEKDTSAPLLRGDFWKDQGLQIMDTWLEHGIDPVDKQFYAFMNREWKTYRSRDKYPGMMARNLFSLSAAFMLSGDPRYIREADTLFTYLHSRGWDTEYGGWFYAIDQNGFPVDFRKDLFMNIYAVTGLAIYYMASHNRTALKYIRKTHSLLEDKAWDKRNSGYYRRLSRQWEVINAKKVFTPQVAPISGYLLYLYTATRDGIYLDKARQLISLTLKNMRAQENGWIREKFKKDWSEIVQRGEEQINIGHNIEVAWMLLRLEAIDSPGNYKKPALELNKQLLRHTFTSTGAWLHRMNLNDYDQYPETTPWWIQAYGNMLQLYMYQATGEDRYLKTFQKGAAFWNQSFIDRRYGGTLLSVTLNGKIHKGAKAVRTKTSYHALEHSLLNYLYLRLWVENKTATLYFRLDRQSDSQPLCPLPIEDIDTEIISVIDNEKPLNYKQTGNKQCLDITDREKDQILKITLE